MHHRPVCFNNTATTTAVVVAATRNHRSTSSFPSLPVAISILQSATFPSIPSSSTSFPPLRIGKNGKRSRDERNKETLRLINQALDIVQGIDDEGNE